MTIASNLLFHRIGKTAAGRFAVYILQILTMLLQFFQGALDADISGSHFMRAHLKQCQEMPGAALRSGAILIQPLQFIDQVSQQVLFQDKGVPDHLAAARGDSLHIAAREEAQSFQDPEQFQPIEARVAQQVMEESVGEKA